MPGLYAVLEPYAVAEAVAAGRLQASLLIEPDLRRHVVLAVPNHGKLSAATPPWRRRSKR